MKAFVDKDTCTGCTICSIICPEVFVMDDDRKAKSIVDEVPKKSEACTKKAEDACRAKAITVS